MDFFIDSVGKNSHFLYVLGIIVVFIMKFGSWNDLFELLSLLYFFKFKKYPLLNFNTTKFLNSLFRITWLVFISILPEYWNDGKAGHNVPTPNSASHEAIVVILLFASDVMI